MTATAFYIDKFPIYAAQYISNDEILLAGGGGPSKSGYKNRIATYSIPQSIASSKNEKERKGVCVNEVCLADDEDAPSSLAVHNDLILTGVNESSKARKSGDNHHLRSFRLSEKGIKVKLVHQIFDLDVALDDYQKITKISSDGKHVGLVSAEGQAAIVDVAKMTTLKTLDDKVIDIEFDADKIWVATQSKVYLMSMNNNDRSTVFDCEKLGVIHKHKISQVRVIGKRIVIGLNSGSAFLGVYEMYKGGLIQKHIIYTKKIINIFVSPAQDMIAVTTSDSKLSLYRPDLSLITSWSKLHAFPISTVAFSPSRKELLTGSIDEKINIIDLTTIGTSNMLKSSLLVLVIFTIIYMLFIFRQLSVGPSFEQRVFQEL